MTKRRTTVIDGVRLGSRQLRLLDWIVSLGGTIEADTYNRAHPNTPPQWSSTEDVLKALTAKGLVEPTGTGQAILGVLGGGSSPIDFHWDYRLTAKGRRIADLLESR